MNQKLITMVSDQDFHTHSRSFHNMNVSIPRYGDVI